MTPKILDLSEKDYHSDKTGDGPPSLSSSIATQLLNRSPFHAWLHHPRLGNVKRESTDSMDNGTIIHALVLGQKPPVEILPFENFRKKEAQEKRDAAVESGKIPVLEREWGGLQTTGKAIVRELAERGIQLTGKSEQVVVWEEETEHGPIRCRGMMDHLWLSQAAVFDLKNCRSAHPKAVRSHVMEYGYPVQASAYRSALRKLNPEMAGRESFTWGFVEQMPLGSPKRVLITVAQPSGLMREYGDAQWAKACNLWAWCLKNDRWPDYTGDEVLSLDPPGWAVNEEF